MTAIFARRALLPDGWAHDVSVALRDGKILSVAADSQPADGAARVDVLLPGLANTHSHSFQRAMAGMTERRRAGRQSFWTWRELMYRFADRIEPDEVEAIAALVFMEMLEAGYSAVGEFHYLHHQRGGAPYEALDEMAQRIFAAASTTGIGVTLLPVLYTYGGVGKASLAPEQHRFGNNVDRFARLVAEAKRHTPSCDCLVGIAPHSLRATAPDDLARALAAHPKDPVHIHIAEQVKEVDDIKALMGARPVEWLLANANVDERWQLVHATHMTTEETRAMAQSGAVAGLCPITEANLGDGIFNGAEYLAAGGVFSIGSDSNVRIALTEELRLLEYSQRLKLMERSVLAGVDGGESGDALWCGAAMGGARALARASGEIAAGKLADLVGIDASDPALAALDDTQLLSGLIFACGDDVVTDVWSAGRHVVSGGRHQARDAIIASYNAALKKLLARA